MQKACKEQSTVELALASRGTTNNSDSDTAHKSVLPKQKERVRDQNREKLGENEAHEQMVVQQLRKEQFVPTRFDCRKEKQQCDQLDERRRYD